MRFHEKLAAAGQGALFMPESTWTPPAELPQLAGRGIRRLSYDLETKDPDLAQKGPGVRRGAKIVGLAIGVDDGPRWYFPVGHEGGGNLDRGRVMEWARDELNRYDGELVGHTLSYDLDFSYEEGITFPLVSAFHDVAICEPLIDEWRDEYNLDALSRDYLGVGKDHELLDQARVALGFSSMGALKSNLWRLPANLAGPYAEADVDRPLRLLPLQLKAIYAEGLQAVYDVERKLPPILVRMRRRGVRVNVPGIERLRAELVTRRAELVSELKRVAGPRAELMEPETLAPALREAGLDVPLTKKTAVASITKPWLERHLSVPLCRLIMNGRQVNTLINTFVDGQLLGHVLNGRIHPTWRQLKADDGGTIGRFSGADPNLQFIPARDEDWSPLMRGAFLPEEGEEWQAADASQIEYRFLAHFAVGQGAAEARAAYRADPRTDFHRVTALMMGGVDPDDPGFKKTTVYKRIKNTNFCKVYGGGVPKLADTFGCPVPEAQRFSDRYDERLPFVAATFSAAERWARRRGYVTTVLGRRCRFPFWGPAGYQRREPGPTFRSREEACAYWLAKDDGTGRRYRGRPVERVELVDTYTALNKKLQLSAADMMKKAMVDADEAGIERELGPMLVTVHDEAGHSVPQTRAGREAGFEFARIMELATPVSVPILVKVERGPDWGHTKEVKDERTS